MLSRMLKRTSVVVVLLFLMQVLLVERSRAGESDSLALRIELNLSAIPTHVVAFRADRIVEVKLYPDCDVEMTAIDRRRMSLSRTHASVSASFDSIPAGEYRVTVDIEAYHMRQTTDCIHLLRDTTLTLTLKEPPIAYWVDIYAEPESYSVYFAHTPFNRRNIEKYYIADSGAEGYLEAIAVLDRRQRCYYVLKRHDDIMVTCSERMWFRGISFREDEGYLIETEYRDELDPFRVIAVMRR